ncbi:MAG: hypothetical protein AAF641_14765 [Pseudomonadota bacterium]
MSQTDDTTPLSFPTYLSATERGVLPMTRPSLLGTFSSPDGIKALIRLPNGEIKEMRQNDYVGQARIVELGDGHIDISLMGERHRLMIPKA